MYIDFYLNKVSRKIFFFKILKIKITNFIEKFQSEKDLGVTFDSKLNFTEHISSKVKKANQVYLTTKET